MNDWIALGSRTYIYFVNMKKEDWGFDVIPFISTDVAVTSDDSQVFTCSPNLYLKELIYIFNCQVSSTLVSFADISYSACPKLNIQVFLVQAKLIFCFLLQEVQSPSTQFPELETLGSSCLYQSLTRIYGLWSRVSVSDPHIHFLISIFMIFIQVLVI